MKSLATILLTITAVIGQTWAYPSFQELIPNGNNVPHPCKVNYLWPGVGHLNSRGGGTPNPFGVDFANAGKMWTEDLCHRDSDGDGLSNGEELGDPNCTWEAGEIPPRVTGITHPGICEPYDSELCRDKNVDLDCTLDSFEACETIKNPNVMSVDYRFPPTPVPATETNYFCMTFDLPKDQDYHMIAYEPIIDNANVMHHILLYGCRDDSTPGVPAPEACGMSQNTQDCDDIIGTWGVGVSGFCFPDGLGFRIGATGFKRVRLETHWNNPMKVADYTDSSGLRFYYQPAQPEYKDLMTFLVGQRLLSIPPGQSRVEQIGSCPSECTKTIFEKSPVNVIMVINHMHYLGRSMSIEVFRDGKLYKTLSHDEYYSYDNPVTHSHSPPIQIQAGDEIKTSCVFTSISSNRWVYYGDGTSDEMCFGFITMYSDNELPEEEYCVQMGPISSCGLDNGTPVGNCNWVNFLNPTHLETLQLREDLAKNCNTDGFCRPECREVAQRARNHPCLRDPAAQLLHYLMGYSLEGLQFLARVNSCPVIDCEKQCGDGCGGGSDDDDYGTGNHATTTSAAVTVWIVSFAVTFFRLFGAV